MRIGKQLVPIWRLPIRFPDNIVFQRPFIEGGNACLSRFLIGLSHAGRLEIVAFQEGLDIEPCAADDDGDFALPVDFGNGLTGHIAETGCRIGLVRLGNINEIMVIAGQFVRCRFRRTDIHMAVNLVGVARNEVGPVMFGQGKTERRLADSRRADDGHYFFHESHSNTA